MLTIFLIYTFLFYVSYILEKNSDFWYNGFMYCEHVYKTMGSKICPKCGGDTHEVDWEKNRIQIAEHREKYGWFNNTGTWWSI